MGTQSSFVIKLEFCLIPAASFRINLCIFVGIYAVFGMYLGNFYASYGNDM